MEQANQKNYTSKQKVEYYKLLRSLWLNLKYYENKYGEFIFLKENLTKEEQYEELIEYYRSIIKNERSKRK